ncbi:hypothetical protein [Gordonia araii]|nr:hypothetical protein [Gordonia araii]NNG98868.1 hypothetical protein [Gordonia araii NBRC 100433]
MDEPKVVGGGTADCSQSSGTGIAVVVPDPVYVLPLDIWPLPSRPLPSGTAKVIGSGIQFALASTGGKATAISYLPLSLATAGASGGRTSTSFALLGIANAWNTDPISVGVTPVLGALPLIPAIQRLDCLGAVTAAYAEGLGACGNLLGTFDGRILTGDRSIPELQAAITNPFALLDVFTDTDGVLERVIGGLLTGQSLQDIFTADIARLTVGGDRTGQYGLPNLVALTSTYGFQEPITIDWLGQKVVLFPTFKDGDVNGNKGPNYLALPHVIPGTPTLNLPTVTGLNSFTLPFIGNLADAFGLSGILPLSSPGANTVQNAGLNLLAAKQLGVEDKSSASTLAGAGVAPATINKLVTATSPAPATQSAAAKSATPSVKAGDAVKNWQSGAKQSWQGTTDKWQQTQQTWKANQQQRTQSWQQKQQSWTPSWKRSEGAAGQPSQQGAGVAGQNNWSGTSRPQSPFSSGTKPSFGGWGGKSATPSGTGATGATSGGGSN